MYNLSQLYILSQQGSIHFHYETKNAIKQTNASKIIVFAKGLWPSWKQSTH